MAPDPASCAAPAPRPDALLTKALAGMSIFTLLMTVPQVLTIWLSREAAGVSVLSWSAYLLSAFLWFAYGVHKRDKNIYLACIGWILLDAAVIAGALVHG